MRAIILAGGQGRRLLPYTTLIPKPLMPLGGKVSILEVVIMQLARDGFNRLTLAVNHLSNLIMAYCGDGSRWGVTIDYSLEDRPLGTIGPLTLVDDLPEHVLVMNGDILCDLDYGAFLRRHAASNAPVSVAAYHRNVHVDFGVLEFNADHRLTAFREKPVLPMEVSMGIYALRRDVITALPRSQPYGFDQLMLDSLRQNRPVNIHPFRGFWLDIGRADDYAYADEHFDELAIKLGVSP